jgi:hypothetical protein
MPPKLNRIQFSLTGQSVDRSNGVGESRGRYRSHCKYRQWLVESLTGLLIDNHAALGAVLAFDLLDQFRTIGCIVPVARRGPPFRHFAG